MVKSGVVVRPARTVIAALFGGAVGALVLGYGTGYLMSLTGEGESGAWAALGAAFLAAGIGAFLGAGIGLGVAFRDEPGRARVTTIVTTVLLGPLLFVGLVAVADRVSDLAAPPLWLFVALPVSALTGRWLAARQG